ncbi:M1 family metallopeptidase [Aquimarina sp. ERC-38]|uniref:M1 family metallopeptidase n=1 Tax=Aquimarina sp. ERC-38 TaxID=2949996 RepID=UPI002245B159|nr:M1 family metallopeptidase [Aquimarina sp. ERC-38]UZO81822.1 M1 family metallopeptidase [Aquimarina sp. ERC-38]
MNKFSFFICIICIQVWGQNNTSYWQQHVDYQMDVEVNVENYTYTGNQKLVYTNNSPDTLTTVFYHLYFNAFQPGSEMDVRSLSITDPDARVRDRISKLKPDEYGYLEIESIQQDGKVLKPEVSGTILEVPLNQPILPGQKTEFTLGFKGQVPLQIRRSGRNNKEGVALSMTQWYPKMVEYDFEGWHPNPYIGREFHGVWGNFDVKITIDSSYILGGSGYLQNANEIGEGYEKNGVKVKKKKGKTRTWHFIAPNVHDFAWGADPEFLHDKITATNGTELHFLYKNDDKIIENWKKLQPLTVKLLDYFNKNIGTYPYKQYSVIQGGDGGMEYAMCTLITGNRKFGSLVGVTAHELAHSWFQHILATNEAKHEWMDEGFTTYISTLAMDEVMKQNKPDPLAEMYQGYIKLATSNVEKPQTTHADRYDTNFAYGTSAYSKGGVFLAQLGYVIGEENLKKTIKQYFNTWKFKHPTPNDFKRIAENISGMQLDWYLTDWTKTTNVINYGIRSVTNNQDQAIVTLERIGSMPMPIDIMVTYQDDSQEYFYIPLQMMRGQKTNPFQNTKRTVLPDWAWAYPDYQFNIPTSVDNIKTIEIDPLHRMADVHKANNKAVQ